LRHWPRWAGRRGQPRLKLALVVNGQAPDSLLDTYTAERHLVGSRVLRDSRAETALLRTDPQTEALRELVGGIIQTPQAVRHLAEEISGMHIRYSAGSWHPLDGTFAPDLELLWRRHQPAAPAKDAACCFASPTAQRCAGSPTAGVNASTSSPQQPTNRHWPPY
jgi:FAD binding domain